MKRIAICTGLMLGIVFVPYLFGVYIHHNYIGLGRAPLLVILGLGWMLILILSLVGFYLFLITFAIWELAKKLNKSLQESEGSKKMKKNKDGLLRIRGYQIQLCDSNGYWSCLGGTARLRFSRKNESQ
jgi:hypothetical protein